MITNALIGVGTQGDFRKTIPVNPTGKKNKLYPEDLGVLNKVLSEEFTTEEEVVVQVFIITKAQYVEQVYCRTKACFETDFVPWDFSLRKQQIISLTRQNYTVKEIAEKLGVSKSAITKHRRGIYDVLESEYGKPRIPHSIRWYADRMG